MKYKSIRWRLPFSYAGIALLAALSLGSFMLLVLNRYYVNQEMSYLQGNGQALQLIAEHALSENIPLSKLEDTVQGLAFLSQTRIQVFDQDKVMVIDTGIPESNHMISVAQGIEGSVDFSILPSSQNSLAPYIIQAQPSGVAVGTIVTPAEIESFRTDTLVAVAASPYGYEFATVELVTQQKSLPEKRSNQTITVELSNKMGSIEISDGPAYGRDIISSVSKAWGIAGLVAVLLAGVAGIFASNMVTKPVLNLIKATDLMSEGDFSTRINYSVNSTTTEFNSLATSFNGMAQKIENTVATLQTFVSDAAHELHTPLTALRTNLELALEEQNSTDQKKYLESAQKQSLRLESLVSGLLDLSRIEAARTIIKESLDLTQLLQEISLFVASKAEMKGVSFKLELPPDPIYLDANEMQIRRIVSNLLDNAVKFSPIGSNIILQAAQELNQVKLIVKDTGIGIPQEDLPKLFDRFHRARNASRFPGNGLGLAIVKALVEFQGGSITADSELGKGTTMIVNLPLSTNPDSIS